MGWRRKAQLPIRSVLDMGCGNGRNLRAFQIGTAARTLVGMDMCVERAKSLCRAHLCRPVRLVKGKLGTDPIPGKQKFDIILLNYSLMFLDMMEVKRVAEQVGERLARGGWCSVEMYPAKDSECKYDSECHQRMYEFAFMTGIVKATYGLPGLIRQSLNRMVFEKRS
jgi:trans-aconitate methyltransferase